MSGAEIQLGVYQHYKGPLYQVIGLAHDANNETRKVVVYIPLELKRGQTGPRMAVRSLSDFQALLHIHDRSVCPGGAHCSHRFERFTYKGPELTDQLLEKRFVALELDRADRG